MASKGQKYRDYSKELKNEIIGKYLSGNYSLESLGKEYGNISRKTIYNWIYRYRNEIPLKSDRQKGRVKEENIDYKERYEILKKYQAFLKAQRERK
jgi:transposase-like protein